MRRFPIVSRPPGQGSWSQTLILAPPPVSDSGGGTGGGDPEVYLASCFLLLPNPDYKSFLFSIHGLAPGATVEWTLVGDIYDYIMGGEGARGDHSILVASSGGEGSVSATVDGRSAGSATYAGLAADTCHNSDMPI